jgi:hypothetical protein
MTTVQFAVSKARLVNSLLQPKPGEEPLTMLAIDAFFDDLHKAVSNNAYVAIKVASTWFYVRGPRLTLLGKPAQQFLTKHVSQHPDRVALLIQYFTKYSDTLFDNGNEYNRMDSSVGYRMNQHGHSVKALRYNLLCVLADTMGHAHYNKAIISGMAMALKPYIKQFIHSISATYEGLDLSFNVKWYNSTRTLGGSRFEVGLVPILKDWLQRRFFPRKFILELNSVARDAAGFDDDDPPQPDFAGTNDPDDEDNTNLRLPMVHGIPGAPWYEQPATLLFEQLVPARPIETVRIKPKVFNGAPAQEEHVDAVKALLSFAKGLKENKPQDKLIDVDEIGQYTTVDKNGETKKNMTYSGWSPEFIQSFTTNGQGFSS